MPVKESGLWSLCLKPLGFTVSHLVEEPCLWKGVGNSLVPVVGSVDGGEGGKGRKKEHRIRQNVPSFIHTVVNFPQKDCGVL